MGGAIQCFVCEAVVVLEESAVVDVEGPRGGVRRRAVCLSCWRMIEQVGPQIVVKGKSDYVCRKPRSQGDLFAEKFASERREG